MGLFAAIKSTGKAVYSGVSTFTKANKNDLMFAGGMLILGASIFSLCKASTKLPKHTDDLEKEINDIVEKEHDKKISPEEAKKAITDAKKKTAWELFCEYAPGAGGVIVGGIMLGKVHHDLKKTNMGLTAAVAGYQKFMNAYRGRVVAEEGQAKDTHYAYGTTPTETKGYSTGPDGKPIETTTTSQVVSPDEEAAIQQDLSQICIYPSNPLWKNDPGMMLSQIKGRFKQAEDDLLHKRKISRNDIADLFYVDKDYSKWGLKPGYMWDKNKTGNQIDYAVHWVSKDVGDRTKYIPEGATHLEHYIIIELKNLMPDITVPRYRFQ
jgi:hypothetical protein